MLMSAAELQRMFLQKQPPQRLLHNNRNVLVHVLVKTFKTLENLHFVLVHDRTAAQAQVFSTCTTSFIYQMVKCAEILTQ